MTCAKPEQLAGLRITVRDFGSGPCLATESHGATIVLIADSFKRRTALRSCDDRGLLTEEAALPVLRRLCELWNAAVERGEGGR